MKAFIKAVRDRLQHELGTKFPALGVKWLLGELKERSWWLRAERAARPFKTARPWRRRRGAYRDAAQGSGLLCAPPRRGWAAQLRAAGHVSGCSRQSR